MNELDLVLFQQLVLIEPPISTQILRSVIIVHCEWLEFPKKP